MTLQKVTPKGITPLFQYEPPNRADLEPEVHLQSYPDGLAKGEEAPAGESLDDAEQILVLSDPISATQIDPTTSYVLKDLYGRVLSVNGAGSGSWQWAYVGEYNRYPKDVMPLFFSQDPTKGANLTVNTSGTSWPLHANGQASSWEWAFWASSGYGGGSY